MRGRIIFRDMKNWHIFFAMIYLIIRTRRLRRAHISAPNQIIYTCLVKARQKAEHGKWNRMLCIFIGGRLYGGKFLCVSGGT